ncbi:MAG: pilus assembly protein PilM [Phycisphaeraceae bacterium]
MAFGFSRTRHSPIAIDFGADSLKLLQIIPGQPPQLLAAAAAVLPASARQDAAARDAFLADALARLLKSQPFKGKRAICSLPAYQTVVQHLELPRSEGDNLQTALEQQLRQRLDIDARRMVVRHVPVGAVNRQGGQQMEVLCLAAPRDVVMRYITIAGKAKLDVVGMHSEPMSLCKAFEQADAAGQGAAAGKAVCYIDIGAACTKVIITAAGQLKFAKTIHAAGDQITRQVAAAGQIDFDQARQQRVDEAAGRTTQAIDGDAGSAEHAMVAAAAAPMQAHAAHDDARAATGIPALDAQVDEAAAPAAAAKSAASTAAAAAADTIETLVDELQLCLRYYQRLCPDMPVDRLVFLGGEARHVTTCQSIARGVRIAAQLGDPLARATRVTLGKPAVGVNLDDPQPGWAVPFGLCLSEANL